jgi:DNA polymerase-3 subunit epsilon
MTLYLDTETTGLSPARGDAIVEVAIVDGSGRVLIDTLVNPGRSIPWQASSIHGITDDMVRGKPTLAQLMPRVLEIIDSEQVVIYNARFDAPFFPGALSQARSIECAMLRFADARGGRWQKLDMAAQHVGHRWTGVAHRALADTLACRSVWNWLVAHGHAARKAD